jgi:PmbA protein
LIGHFVSAVSGGSLIASPRSWWTAWEEVFSPQITIRAGAPARGQASTPFDDEGVATRPRDVVRDGFLRGYFGSYSDASSP